jgi:hypothetical protein
MFELIDNKGTIYSSSDQHEMEEAFAAMTGNGDFFETKKRFNETKQEWETSWEGDLKLVEVLQISR